MTEDTLKSDKVHADGHLVIAIGHVHGFHGEGAESINQVMEGNIIQVPTDRHHADEANFTAKKKYSQMHKEELTGSSQRAGRECWR